MKYNININQIKCIEFWLNLQQWAIMDIMSQLSTWADPINTEQWIFYYLSFWKLVNELPIISYNKDTFQKQIKILKDKLLLDHYHDVKNSKWYYRLSSKWKEFMGQEKNPEGTGEKSLPPQEKNPDNNTTIYNTTNYTSSLSSNEDSSLVSDTLQYNDDIVELNINNNTKILSTCSNKERNKIKKNVITDEVFLWFWKQYPRKTNKVEARKSLEKHIKTNEDLWLCWYSLFRFNEINKSKWTEIKFIPHATTWINQERFRDFEDEYTELKNNPNKARNHPFFKKFELVSLDESNEQQLKDDDIVIKFKRIYEN